MDPEAKEKQIIKKIWVNPDERRKLLELVIDIINKFKIPIDVLEESIVLFERPDELFKLLYKSKLPISYIIQKFQEETQPQPKVQEIKQPQPKVQEVKDTKGSKEKQKEFLNKFNLTEKQSEQNKQSEKIFDILYNDLENWFKIHDEKNVYRKTSETDEIFFKILIDEIFFYLNADTKEVIKDCIINNKTTKCEQLKNMIKKIFLKEYNNINYKKKVDEYIKNRKYFIINKKQPEKQKTTPNKKTNRWVEHVRAYAKSKNISYACAISEASKTYKK